MVALQLEQLRLELRYFFVFRRGDFGSDLRCSLGHHLLDHFSEHSRQILSHIVLQLGELLPVLKDCLVGLVEKVLVRHHILLEELALALLHLDQLRIKLATILVPPEGLLVGLNLTQVALKCFIQIVRLNLQQVLLRHVLG